MTGARAIAREAARRRRQVAPAVTYVNAAVSAIGERDCWGQIVPPSVREHGSRLIAWAVRRVK